MELHAEPAAAVEKQDWMLSLNRVLWAICILILATLAVYSNSLSGEFIYDDLGNIADNWLIRSLWPVEQCQAPCNAALTFWDAWPLLTEDGGIYREPSSAEL